MDKAYDLDALLKELKEQGLDLAEESAVLVYKALMNWLEASARASANPFDDVVLLVRKQVDEIVLDAIDRIDGEVG